MPPPQDTPGTSGVKRNQDVRTPEDEDDDGFKTAMSKSQKKKARKKAAQAKAPVSPKNQITNYMAPKKTPKSTANKK